MSGRTLPHAKIEQEARHGHERQEVAGEDEGFVRVNWQGLETGYGFLGCRVYTRREVGGEARDGVSEWIRIEIRSSGYERRSARQTFHKLSTVGLISAVIG